MAFDEFAGKEKRVDKALVDVMKNYMANKTFSRGVETLGAEASMVFVGNTQHNVPYMLKNSDLFDELPKQYYDPAFIDRLHAYIPGWEIEVIRAEMFSSRVRVCGGLSRRRFCATCATTIFRTAIRIYLPFRPRFLLGIVMGFNKSFSGLMKLLFPAGGATEALRSRKF